jgi:cell wall-associated NlpC family hydrolase
MPSFKPLSMVALGLVLSTAVVHAEPPVPDNGQSSASASPANHADGKNLTERSLTAVGQAASKISDAINTSAQAFGSGVQHMTSQASALVDRARLAIGTPYRWGGASAATGFDCSGFVRAMVEQTVGRLLPHHAADQAAVTQKIDKDQLLPGDLVFFNTVRRRAYSHVGIYMGDGQFIHAPARGESVRIDNLNETYWQRHFKAARRVLTGDAFPGNGLLASTDGLDPNSSKAAAVAVAVAMATSSGSSATDAVGTAHDDTASGSARANLAANTAVIADAGNPSGVSAAAVSKQLDSPELDPPMYSGQPPAAKHSRSPVRKQTAAHYRGKSKKISHKKHGGGAHRKAR